jgi:hypothetical protein
MAKSNANNPVEISALGPPTRSFFSFSIPDHQHALDDLTSAP